MALETDPKEQPLISHLVELRDRILRCLLVVGIIFLCLFPFANDIYTFVASPLLNVLPEGAQMIATQVTSPFFAPFKLAFFTAVFISVPFLLHQIWAFIAPGLYKNEIKTAFPILVSSIILFYLGIAFSYFVVLSFIFGFFTSVAPEGVAIMTDINEYLSFVLLMFFAFGLTFEIPIATVLLIISGATTPEKLTQKRPYVVIGCFVAGMLLTPADPFSQSMLAIPMWMLFELGVIAGRIIYKKSDEDESEKEDEENEEESP
ncbi:MAG: twin-arginine translocase subunit TatC [SAR86 cluster bacterium]|uniref:Sec-independent protein translocase protein TatC n=1 Tax=SAR86 cluster bacterium TaxID=2030880 RepID=A0A2A5CJN8_9GAMM|nr:MAG: twin-arginine translocase subunit TatC [SAR86 cluster bacterium]